MARRKDLRKWIIAALKAYNGKASLVQVCKYVWERYENELKRSGDLFFTWQYDIRWVAKQLRDEGILAAAESSPRGIWELA
jgi:hypothetical protein